MPPTKDNPEYQDARRELIAFVGEIETPDQIIKASHWLDQIRSDPKSKLKDEVWMDHVNMENKRFFRIWDEISFFRAVGEPTEFVIPGWKPNNFAFDDLCVLGERWVFLAAENALRNLEFHEEIQEVKRNGGTVAQRLTGYLRIHKQRAGFDEWVEVRIKDAKWRVIEVYEVFMKENRRPRYRSGVETPDICPQILFIVLMMRLL